MSILTGYNPFADYKKSLQESYLLTEANEDNDAKATAYEARVAMHIHDKTAAKDNNDPKFRDAHAETVARYHDRMSRLKPKDHEEVEKAAKTSANSYLKSLKANHGINPDDIHEIHHTAKGIDKHVGKKVNQLQNPHDVLIKTKDGKMHGSSLKMSTKSPTVNNSTMKTADDMMKDAGMQGNAHDMWTAEKENRGYDKMTTKDLKAHMKSDPDLREKERLDHLEHRSKIAKTQADNFNAGTHEQKRKFLDGLTKSNPDLDYDYTAGDKDYSTPINKHPAIAKIKAAKSLTAVHNGSSSYAIQDHEGNQLFHMDYRTNHGPWVGPVATGKFGNLKPSTKKPAPKDKDNDQGYSRMTQHSKYKQ